MPRSHVSCQSRSTLPFGPGIVGLIRTFRIRREG